MTGMPHGSEYIASTGQTFVDLSHEKPSTKSHSISRGEK